MSNILKAGVLALIATAAITTNATLCDSYLKYSNYPSKLLPFAEGGLPFAFDSEGSRFFGYVYGSHSGHQLDTFGVQGNLLYSEFTDYQSILDLKETYQASSDFAQFINLDAEILDLYISEAHVSSLSQRIDGFEAARKAFAISASQIQQEAAVRLPNVEDYEGEKLDFVRVSNSSTLGYFRSFYSGRILILQAFDFTTQQLIGPQIEIDLTGSYYYGRIHFSEELIAIEVVGESKIAKTQFFDRATGERVRRNPLNFLGSKFDLKNYTTPPEHKENNGIIRLKNGDFLTVNSEADLIEIRNGDNFTIKNTIQIDKNLIADIKSSYSGIEFYEVSSFEMNGNEIWIFLLGDLENIGLIKIKND